MDFATVLELVGVACVVLAAWLFSPILGLLSLGAALVLIGWLMERD